MEFQNDTVKYTAPVQYNNANSLYVYSNFDHFPTELPPESHKTDKEGNRNGLKCEGWQI